jgi:hypothetical protein
MNSEKEIELYYAKKLCGKLCIVELLNYWTFLLKNQPKSFSEKIASIAINLKLEGGKNEL